MIRRLAVPLLLAGLVLGACTEDLLAPGEGTCPAYCPPEQVAVVDSVLLESVSADSTFEGYVLPHEAGGLQLVDDPGGAVPASRAVIRSLAFAERLLLASGDTTTGPVIGTDSLTVKVTVQRWAGDSVELAFYRLPTAVDSEAPFDSLDPFFADSALIGAVLIPDSLVPGDDLTVRLSADAFPTFDADGRVAAVGVAARTVGGGYATLGTLESASAPTLTRYAQVDSAGVAVPRSEGKLPEFDTYAAPDPPPVPPDRLRIGGSPSARALYRFVLPARIADSSTVVRATLLLVPSEPVRGAPGDTLRLLAQGVAVDVGAKSPLLSVASDSLSLLLGLMAAGSTDTVRLDVTGLLLRWAADSTRARTIVVRAFPEGNALTDAVVGSSSGADARPALHLTFVPPLTLGGR